MQLTKITMGLHAHIRKQHWNVSKIYQCEWESYFNNQNAMTFMIANASEPKNWVDIMFNHMKKKLQHQTAT